MLPCGQPLAALAEASRQVARPSREGDPVGREVGLEERGAGLEAVADRRLTGVVVVGQGAAAPGRSGSRAAWPCRAPGSPACRPGVAVARVGARRRERRARRARCSRRPWARRGSARGRSSRRRSRRRCPCRRAGRRRSRRPRSARRPGPSAGGRGVVGRRVHLEREVVAGVRHRAVRLVQAGAGHVRRRERSARPRHRRSPPAETVPAAGVAASAEATYAEAPPARSSRPRPAASEAAPRREQGAGEHRVTLRRRWR